MTAYSDLITTVRFDEEMLKYFSGYDTNNPEKYFKAHPRARKAPMESLWGKTRKGLIPSINKFLNVGASNGKGGKTPSKTNMARVTQNQWENHLKEYCEYCMKAQGIKYDYIDKCVMLVVQYKPTASKSDNNNIYNKPFIDGMVERELLKEDNYTVVQFHAEFSVVDRQDPRSEIKIFPITDEYPFEIAMMELTNHVMELHSKYADSFVQKK